MPLNEGQTVQYTVTTTNTADGTVLYWKTTGNTTNSDIVGGNTGTITVTNNRAYINVTMSSDTSTDGTKTLGISLLTGSLSGTTVAATDPNTPIIVQDTSQAPQYSIRLFAMGEGRSGQLPLNSVGSRSSPVQVGTDTDWKTSHVTRTALKSNNTLWAWGENLYGQMGSNDRVYRSSPVQIGSETWSKITGGYATKLGIKTNGSLWFWGADYYGSSGLNLPVNLYRSSPVQVGTETTWSDIAIDGLGGVFAIKTNGTLWTWGGGNDFGGHFGLNNISPGQRSSPVQVGSLTNWSKIYASKLHWLAIKTDGTLWGCGRGRYGQLSSPSVYRSSPVQIGSGTDWALAQCSGYTSFGIKTNGTLWAWGFNGAGQLGINVSGGSMNNNYRSSPVQIAGTTWSKLTNKTGDNANSDMAAIKTDGTLWVWGLYTQGSHGINAVTTGFPLYEDKRSSPTQVGTGTTWDSFVSDGSYSQAFTSVLN